MVLGYGYVKSKAIWTSPALSNDVTVIIRERDQWCACEVKSELLQIKRSSSSTGALD